MESFDEELLKPWTELYTFLANNEAEIATGVSDFGDLIGVFRLLFKRDPSTNHY